VIVFHENARLCITKTPSSGLQTSHCYFPIAFSTQPPVPFRMSLISMAFVTDGTCEIHRARFFCHEAGSSARMLTFRQHRRLAIGAVENVKEIAEMIGKFHDIELNRRILKLEEEVLDLSRAKRRAEDKVEELQQVLKVRETIIYRDPYYFVMREGTP
jgi:hypothetical protein